MKMKFSALQLWEFITPTGVIYITIRGVVGDLVAFTTQKNNISAKESKVQWLTHEQFQKQYVNQGAEAFD